VAVTPEKRFEPSDTTIGRCKSSDTLPEGAVRISDSVVLARFHQIISKSNDINIWTFKYAAYMLAGLSGASGLALNLIMRRRIGLTSSGIGSSLPAVVVPAAATLAFQDRLMDRVLTKNIDSWGFASIKCTTYQLTLGCMFPSFMAYFGTVSLTRLYTDKWIPPLKDFEATKKWTLDTLRPAKNKLACIVLANAVVACGIAVLMVQQAPNVWRHFNYIPSLNEEKLGSDSAPTSLPGPPRDKGEVAASASSTLRPDSLHKQQGRLQGLSS